ncbi:MAG: thioredoxin domain-containing protein [Candidatus Paceibacterota bacterium]|jgi:thiol-disulfide isomerase/thioredoxin
MKIKIFFSIIIILVLGSIITIVSKNSAPKTSSKYDSFAICLKDKGAVFYGAFWCTHCKAQKELFGSSEKLLSYVECSTPDAQEQTQICKEKDIKGYPTWIFADDTRLSGEIPLVTLAEKTGCVLPPEIPQ